MSWMAYSVPIDNAFLNIVVGEQFGLRIDHEGLQAEGESVGLADTGLDGDKHLITSMND